MSNYIKGVDVSAHQPPDSIDWAKLYAQGVRYAIIKAADGIGDNTYQAGEHAEKAFQAGMRIGYYSYSRPRSVPKYDAERQYGVGWEATATGQANQLVKNVQGLPFPSMGLWLDLESNADNMDPKTLAAWSLKFLTVLESEKYAAGIYSGYYFFLGNVYPEEALAEYPLWIPWYTGEPTGPKQVPAPWKTWAIHQWTDQGELDGYDGPLDLDVARPTAYRSILFRSRLMRMPSLFRWVLG